MATQTHDLSDDRLAIIGKVERLSELLFNRDPGIVDELWSPGFRLVGSEKGEIAEDRESLAALMARLFERAQRYALDFSRNEVEVRGDVCWLFAEGDVVLTDIATTTRSPYRLAAVFAREGGEWRWRLFCGSEPV